MFSVCLLCMFLCMRLVVCFCVSVFCGLVDVLLFLLLKPICGVMGLCLCLFLLCFSVRVSCMFMSLYYVFGFTFLVSLAVFCFRCMFCRFQSFCFPDFWFIFPVFRFSVFRFSFFWCGV